VKKKKCVSCGRLKPLSEFGVMHARPDGLHYYCRDCLREKSAAKYARRKAGLPPRVRTRAGWAAQADVTAENQPRLSAAEREARRIDRMLDDHAEWVATVAAQ